MNEMVDDTRKLYDELGRYGPYSTLAPNNRGGAKSRYVAAVFDAALLPLFARETRPVRLLDFGCGTGIFTVQVQRYADPVVGIDISQGMLHVARDLAKQHNCPIPLVQYDGLRIPFAEAAFNRIVARGSLCHVPDSCIVDVLAELARVLEPQGMFYLLEQVSESPRWQRHPASPLQKRRGVDELIGLFTDAGFELESARTVRQPRFPWIYLIWFRLIPSRFIPPLARMEVLWNRYLCRLKTNRWQDDLFVFRRRHDAD